MRQLYERYKGYAMSIGLRYIAEVSDVEDVVQDSFVTILTSIGKFDYRGEGSLKGWIGRIVANKAFDFVKHHEYPYPLISFDENINQKYVGSEIRIMTTTHNRSGKLTRLYHICVKILSK